MNEIEERAIGVAEGLDEIGNALLGPEKGVPLAGNVHATISQRIGQEEEGMGTPEQQAEAKVGDEILTVIEKDVFGITPKVSHCIDAITGFPTDLPKTG